MTASALSSISASSHRKRKAASDGRRRGKVSLAGPAWLTNPMPALGREQAVVVAHRVVPCPFDGRPLGVEVNRRVDVLAQELSHDRLSPSAFHVGRWLQAIFERGSGARLGSGGWDIAGSRDQTVAHERKIRCSVDDARKVRDLVALVDAVIGPVGTRFVRAILAEGETFSGYARRTGRGSSEAAAGKIADRFRWLLEALAEDPAVAGNAVAMGSEKQRIRATREQ